jgi:Hypervirulence associated proteins TUDOR domain
MSTGRVDTEEERANQPGVQEGDRVTWRSHRGKAEGEVLRKITEDTELAGRKVRASKDDPQYLVRSDKSGGEAVHKPSALRKRG